MRLSAPWMLVALPPVSIAMLACGGDDDGTGPEAEKLSRVQFEMQTRGSALPVPPGPHMFLFDSVPVPSSLTVLELNGIELNAAGEVDSAPGHTINWTIESGGGSLASSSTEPDGGRVGNQWFLGPMIPGTVQSIVLTAPDVPEYTQHLRIRIFQPPMQVELSEPLQLTAVVGTALPEPFTIRLLDGTGAPLSRAPVRFSASGTLEYFGDTVTVAHHLCGIYCENDQPVVFTYTDDNGEASVKVTLGTTATTQGSVGATVEIPFPLEGTSYIWWQPLPGWTITVLPGPASQLTILSGNNQSGSVGGTLPLPLVVLVTDQYGNRRADDPVTWTITSGGGLLAAPVTRTNGLGETSNTWTLGPAAGAQTVSADIGPASVTFTVVAGGA